MAGFPSGFGSREATFDAYDEFVPDNVPVPGNFLEGHDVLAGRDHAGVHRLAQRLFERRGVYDMTFGYNLAKLNLDHRHPEAGFRYAVEADDPTTLRAEFTPTTEFCPQSDTLTVGAFRAFNAESDSHEFDLVRVRVDEMHHQSTAINRRLAELDQSYEETGDVRAAVEAADAATGSAGQNAGESAPGDDAPF
ncbi:hypothetical protein ACKVMT_02995 [Halobacteriales archaeon Cl-PHB]